MTSAFIRECSLLFRFVQVKFRERANSPLWRFVGGQRELDYDSDVVIAVKSKIPVFEATPAVPVAAPIPPSVKQQNLIEKLIKQFDAKANARDLRKQEAARREAMKHASQNNQLEIDFTAAEQQPEEPNITVDVAPMYEDEEYILPPLSFFVTGDTRSEVNVEEEQKIRLQIQNCLDSFNIDADVKDAVHGPQVTLYKIYTGKGVKVSTIPSFTDDLKMSLSAPSLRVLAPVAGHPYVGIEVPNSKADIVLCGGIFNGNAWNRSKAHIPIILGRNIHGDDIILDLSKAPHLLVAGATGSGKSVCLNCFIVSLITKFRPDELKLILVDPKVVEMNMYNKLPHLVVPVINDMELILMALQWLVVEMERRYRILSLAKVRNIADFNSRPHSDEAVLDDDMKPIPDKMPFIVLIIDELADVMSYNKKDVEVPLQRLAAKSRAVGIHTILATQRPSVDVLTGTIKNNFPTRIAFKTSSLVDSRTILDSAGAEALLGRGDMLFRPPNADGMERIQSSMVTDAEIEQVVNFCAAQRSFPKSFDTIKTAASQADGGDENDSEGSNVDEDLLEQAKELVVRDRKPSISYIQRKLRIGYNRAASLMDALEKRGVVGPQLSNGKREILIDDL